MTLSCNSPSELIITNLDLHKVISEMEGSFITIQLKTNEKNQTVINIINDKSLECEEYRCSGYVGKKYVGVYISGKDSVNEISEIIGECTDNSDCESIDIDLDYIVAPGEIKLVEYLLIGNDLIPISN